MINQTSIDAAYPLAESLANSNLAISPLAETPLSKMISSMYSATLDIGAIRTNTDAISMSLADEIIKASTQADQSGIVRHDITMDEIVPVVVTCVQNGINVARNVVNPIIQALVADVNSSVTDMEAKAGTLVGVMPVFYNDVWSNPVLQGMVDRYNETAAEDVALTVAVPLPVNVNFFDMVKTASDRINGDLKAWIEAFGNERAARVYIDVFGPAESRLNVLRPYTNIVTSDIDDTLFVHLVARNLLEAVPEGVTVDLATYRAAMTSIMVQTGQSVYRILERRADDIKRNQLVRKYPAIKLEYLDVGQGSIQVNGDVYNKWLKEGGSPEVLFGAYVTDQMRDYKALLTNKDEYIAAWERQSRVMQTKARFNRFNNTVTAFKLALAKQINNADNAIVLLPKEEMHRRAAEWVQSITQSQLENLYLLARRCICDIMFGHTDAEAILEAVDAAAKANPAIDIREAALLATIEIVGMWIGEMISID